MDTKEIIKLTLSGLEITAKRKIKVLGVTKAQDDLERIKDMIDELVCFWELEEELMDKYDVEIEKYRSEFIFN